MTSHDRVNKAFDRAADWNRDLFEKIGDPITIHNIERTGYDDHRNPIPNQFEEISTYGEIIPSENIDSYTRNLFGIRNDLEIVVITSDEHDVYEGDESDTTMPSRITIRKEEHTVLNVWDREDGTIQINCEQ